MRDIHEENEVTRVVIDSRSGIPNRRVLKEFAGLQIHVSKRRKVSTPPVVTQPFKRGDVSGISRVSVVRPLPITEPRGLDKPMGRDIVLGIADPGASRVPFEDFEGGKHDSTRRRSDCRENAIAAVGDVHRRSGDRFVALEVFQGHDPAAGLDRWSGRPRLSARCVRIWKGLTGDDVLCDRSGIKRVGALLGNAGRGYYQYVGEGLEIRTDSSRVSANFFR